MHNNVTWDNLEPKRQCKANRTDGQKCRAYALTGLEVCNYHGGMTPQAQPKAKTAKALQIYARMTNTYGAPVETSPEEGLLDEIARTNGHILWLQEQLLTSDPKSLASSAWLYRRSVDSTIRWDDETTRLAGEAYEGVWLDLYLKERGHFAKLCDIAIKANIAQRRIDLAAAQAERVGQAIMQLLTALGHDTADPTVRAAAFQALTAAAGAGRAMEVEGEVVA
jgi:hypothetical protein